MSTTDGDRHAATWSRRTEASTRVSATDLRGAREATDTRVESIGAEQHPRPPKRGSNGTGEATRQRDSPRILVVVPDERDAGGQRGSATSALPRIRNNRAIRNEARGSEQGARFSAAADGCPDRSASPF